MLPPAPLKETLCNNNASVSTLQGSVLGLRIEWNCDLDRDYDDCKPRYSARRLDDRNARVSPGFNFRYNSILASTYSHAMPQNRFANTWMAEDGTYRRQLIKAYGIRVNIVIIGVVRVFIK